MISYFSLTCFFLCCSRKDRAQQFEVADFSHFWAGQVLAPCRRNKTFSLLAKLKELTFLLRLAKSHMEAETWEFSTRRGNMSNCRGWEWKDGKLDLSVAIIFLIRCWPLHCNSTTTLDNAAQKCWTITQEVEKWNYFFSLCTCFVSICQNHYIHHQIPVLKHTVEDL